MCARLSEAEGVRDRDSICDHGLLGMDCCRVVTHMVVMEPLQTAPVLFVWWRRSRQVSFLLLTVLVSGKEWHGLAQEK